jgi:hypothetical protein
LNGYLTRRISNKVVNLTTADLHIGNIRLGQTDIVQNRSFRGSISNIRISDTVVYTSNFTPPSLPLSNSGARFLLLGTNPSNRYQDTGYINSTVTGSATVTIS